MINEKNFPTFLYFMKCYFCQTFTFRDLEMLVKEFNRLESKEDRKLLKGELAMLQKYDWQEIKWFTYRYCGWKPKKKESVSFVLNTMMDNLE